jgi:hypothetical protein
VNLGYVWLRKDAEKTFSVGIRQGESAEGYNPVWIEKVFSLYNAPPGTLQRMPVYFYVSQTTGLSVAIRSWHSSTTIGSSRCPVIGQW